MLLLFMNGCSVYMAANQPDKKDLSVLEEGTDRYAVIAELGKPLASEEKDQRKIDVYKFVQGYSTANKAARAIGHGIVSVYTLGLWEVFGTPIEGAHDGDEVQLKIEYDENEKISNVVVFKGGEAVSQKEPMGS